MQKKILIIDDDIGLCELLSEYLVSEGFLVDTVQDGARGAERAMTEDYSFVVLDVMLPGLNGFEVLSRIRRSSNVAVVMLTARGEEVDRIVGLEMGADDYLPKPFNPRELVARLRAVQRRMQQEPQGGDAAPARLCVGDVELDFGTRTVRASGEPVELTSLEFSVLEALARSAGRVLSREELTRQALGRPFNAFDRSIDVHVSSIRKKLGPLPGGMERIKSVRGIGYLYSHSAQPH
ncbi:response regulator transcription factor [Geomonas oryzisoli]|uniref:Response regulator transcription factor n=1 Tax=Geomonas oryzisoli TaxID=2847992 RepID=A0ABX8JBY5_9BACT|nr:response regulator transcription factor [Geomonas oryzisoli]QWV94642.1 response regulator transcription factor [Geomonas oryzisoli]